MKVLMITGDGVFGPGHPRFELQKSAVTELVAVYVGRGPAGWRIWPAIPAGQFDVVSSQDPFWRGLFAWYAARRLGAKLNIQVHADLAGQSWLRQQFAQVILNHADSIRVVSERVKHEIERLGVQAPITVLPVYIDISKYQAIIRQPHEGKIILWIGRFEKEKNPDLAIAVASKIPDAKLIMLGKGTLEPQLRKAAKDLPVEFPGWQDPRPYLAQADVVLSTSPYESFGASIVEALAAGVPVVAPDVGIAREAGATVVGRPDLHRAVAEALRAGARGELRLKLLDEDAWARAWKESL